ncbi:MAG: peptidoglycan recognition protein family protein [Lachnospiraceae bacterium]|nr:peptidoglycan recognition protein family protein [Lachnospiraceae bacterium]
MAVDLVYDQTKREKAEKAAPVMKEIVPEEEEMQGIKKPAITEDFLEVNDYSRPGTELPVVNSVFVHYTANPGTSARQNRSYFANLAETHERSASAHFIIGYEGEIVQCIPLDEQAYAVMSRNEDSISIECCYLEADGQFTQETYDSLVHLLAWLKQEYQLGNDDILRHYDCGGKKCPIYYVEHEDAWQKLLSDVDTYRREHEASQL